MTNLIRDDHDIFADELGQSAYAGNLLYFIGMNSENDKDRVDILDSVANAANEDRTKETDEKTSKLVKFYMGQLDEGLLPVEKFDMREVLNYAIQEMDMGRQREIIHFVSLYIKDELLKFKGE